MKEYEELQDITKMHQDIEDEEELDLIKLVNTNANDTSQYLIFVGSDDQYYAKNVSKIEELLVYKDIEIMKNNDDQLIVGTADIRGNMTAIVNFDKWFGNEVLDDKDYELIVLAHYGGLRMGIMIKSVEYIVNIPSDTMVSNTNNNEKTSFITKVQVGSKNVLCSVFDSDKMLLDVFDKVDAQSSEEISKFESLEKMDKKVLFADDSRFIRKMVKDLFETLNLTYEIYEDGKQLIDALKHINVEEIGLFITDLEMPVMGGREVVKIIRKEKDYKNIKIIVHTNMSNDIMEDALISSGVDKIIGKVNMLKLGEAIKDMII